MPDSKNYLRNNLMMNLLRFKPKQSTHISAIDIWEKIDHLSLLFTIKFFTNGIGKGTNRDKIHYETQSNTY